MTKRVLAIGVGGSGKEAITILKERLLETYGVMPENVVLLSLDTDDLRDEDTFAGVQLSASYDNRGREAEYKPVISEASVTIDSVFADLRAGRTAAYMNWLEHNQLDKILGPAEKDIRGGAQQRRPIGRIALFQNWTLIAASIRDALYRVYGQPDTQQPIDVIQKEKSKRLVFVVGSVSGGTGSGFMVDVINIVRHEVQKNSNWQSIDVAAIIPLPNAFSAYAKGQNQQTVGNIKPNAYAALRELDRFIRTHNSNLPYMIRYGNDMDSITWSTSRPVDHVYLVDTASSGGVGKFNLEGDPKQGVFPVIADFIMAHVDNGMGDSIATLRSNAGQHYNETEGWMYSSFNAQTYILPVNDIIDDFSYRFLRTLLARLFMPVLNDKRRFQVEDDATKETETKFSERSVGGTTIPDIVPKAIACTRKMDPEQPDTSWPGLFNMVSLSDGVFAEHYQKLQDWLATIHYRLSPSKEGEHKNERFDEGYRRLLNDSDYFLETCLGRQTDPYNEEARWGGEWDKILEPYRRELRVRFTAAVDQVILDSLNKRDEKKELLPYRLPEALAIIKTLKAKLVAFKAVLENNYREYAVDTRLRQNSEDLRNAITWMQDTMETKTWVLLGKPEAYKAQEAYIALFVEKMELALHQRIYRAVVDILDTLGAAEKDTDDNKSVLDKAILELENWQDTFGKVDKILDQKRRQLKKYRQEKNQIRVRRYLTDDAFEDELYGKDEHKGRASAKILGELKGQKGIIWDKVNELIPLSYKMITIWSEEATGAEKIADSFFKGARDVFQVVRQSVTVADRIATEFTSPSSFVNIAAEVKEPFLRYSPAGNANPQLKNEQYVAFKQIKAQDESQKFLTQATGTLKNNGINVTSAAESDVACMVLEITRGVRLDAVEQFKACEASYRQKIYDGRESLHLFSEEQSATRFEKRIEILGEAENRRRPLSPELVITMGDEDKLKLFTLACAYGVIKYDTYTDPKTKAESQEVLIFLTPRGEEKKPRAERNLVKRRLSNRELLQKLDDKFSQVEGTEQRARLYLNALQNFVLLATQKDGVQELTEATLVNTLKERGVSLDHIDLPLTLKRSAVAAEITSAVEALGPSKETYPNDDERKKYNIPNRVSQLRNYIVNDVTAFKNSPAARIKDMGTIMHLILHDEIEQFISSDPH